MAITLPAVLGTRITKDSFGDTIFNSSNDSVSVKKTWEIEQVDGGALDAVGPGTRYASGEGLKLWGAGGTLTIFLDASDGSADFSGDVHIGGTTLIDEDTTIEGTLTVHADMTTDGTLTVMSGASAVFVVDGSGATLTGKLIAGDIEIDDGTMSLGSGAASITFASGAIQVSDDLTVGGALQVSSTFDVTGTFTAHGNANLGDAPGDTVGMHGFGTARQTVTGSRGGNAALADLLSKLDAKGVIEDGTSA